MEKINGYDLPFDLGKLKHKIDLIEQDGPLLSLYYNDRGDYYLLYWLDCDDRENRWMILRVDINSLYDYLNKDESLLQLIKNSPDNFVWITDINNQGKQTKTQALPIESVPSQYLPDEDSWFEFAHQQELLKDVGTDKFELDIPKSDKNLFSSLISKMGWRITPQTIHRLIDKVAF